MISNKQIIDKLQTYYLKQQPSLIARILANMMIDIYRIHNMESLSEGERSCLKFRIKKNCEELEKFARDECSEELKLFNLEGSYDG